jgi:hypothetical protein
VTKIEGEEGLYRRERMNDVGGNVSRQVRGRGEPDALIQQNLACSQSAMLFPCCC